MLDELFFKDPATNFFFCFTFLVAIMFAVFFGVANIACQMNKRKFYGPDD